MTRQSDSRITTSTKKWPRMAGISPMTASFLWFYAPSSNPGSSGESKICFQNQSSKMPFSVELSHLPIPCRELLDGGVKGSPFFNLKISISYPTVKSWQTQVTWSASLVVGAVWIYFWFVFSGMLLFIPTVVDSRSFQVNSVPSILTEPQQTLTGSAEMGPF